MKKLLFAAITVCLAGSMVSAKMFKVPSANTDQPALIDYGGTEYSTGPINTIGTAHSTASVSPCVFQSVYFSSAAIAGQAYDYVEIWDSTSVVNTAGAVSFRVYNTAGSTSVAVGSSNPTYPIRMRKGLIWRPSVASYNQILIQLFKPVN